MRPDLIRGAMYTGCVSTALVALMFADSIAPLKEIAAWAAREAYTAAIFFVPSITVDELHADYRNVSAGSSVPTKNIRVLIVPGHRPDVGGTAFGGVYERNLVVDLADALAAHLAQDPHYEVMVARTKTAWHPVLQTYFDTRALEIDTFRQSQALQMATYMAEGSILPAEDQVYHLSAPTQAARELYGINKWTSENGYDITLHLHLNDVAGRRRFREGKASGFAIYVPDRQYSNAEASKAIGAAIAGRLNAYHATSTLPKEDVGIVEDQQLIAIGSNNTADGAALLIEYGYIYEPQFELDTVRRAAIADYAYQTYLGLQDFFMDPVTPTYGSLSLPYDWTAVAGAIKDRGQGIYALQAALHYLGYYPPVGRTFTDCPISGTFGTCTRAALSVFQEAQGFEATGKLGPQTREALFNAFPTP